MNMRRNSPESVEEHRVAGRTLNTACGEQCTTIMSSCENAFDGCLRTSCCNELLITTRVGAFGSVLDGGSITWNANGTGSSFCAIVSGGVDYKCMS